MELLNALSTPRANELFVQNSIRALCQTTDDIGNCVHIAGTVAGGLHQVTTCDPTDFSKMPAIGVIVEKETPTLCTVLLIGELQGVYTGLTLKRVVFVGLDGKIQEGPPTPSVGGFVFVQRVGSVTDDGRIYVVPNFHLIKRID